MVFDRSQRARAFALVLVWSLGQLTTAHAANASLRVLVQVRSAQDRQLLQRLRGQLSDIDAEIVPFETESADLAPEAQVEAARRLARAEAADAVLWFDARAESAELVVQLWVAANATLVTRAVFIKPQPGSGSSDVLEVAALIARGSVSALVMARERSAAAPQPAAAETEPNAPPPMAAVPVAANSARTLTESAKPAAAVTTPAPAARATDARAPEPVVSASEASSSDAVDEPPGPALLQPRVFVGAQSVIDGVSNLGQHALALRVGLALRSITFSLFGAAGLGSALSDPYVDLHITRHSAGLAIDVEQRLWGAWQAAFGLHAGAALYQRSSVAKDVRVAGTGTSLVAAFALGPELALQYKPGWFGLALHLALDVLPAAPSFRLRANQGSEPTPHTPWLLEPRAALGLEAAF